MSGHNAERCRAAPVFRHASVGQEAQLPQVLPDPQPASAFLLPKGICQIPCAICVTAPQEKLTACYQCWKSRVCTAEYWLDISNKDMYALFACRFEPIQRGTSAVVKQDGAPWRRCLILLSFSAFARFCSSFLGRCAPVIQWVAARAQASMLNEWADPFPVREFLDLHMMVSCAAVPLNAVHAGISACRQWKALFSGVCIRLSCTFWSCNVTAVIKIALVKRRRW